MMLYIDMRVVSMGGSLGFVFNYLETVMKNGFRLENSLELFSLRVLIFGA